MICYPTVSLCKTYNVTWFMVHFLGMRKKYIFVHAKNQEVFNNFPSRNKCCPQPIYYKQLYFFFFFCKLKVLVRVKRKCCTDFLIPSHSNNDNNDNMHAMCTLYITHTSGINI